jgi:transposase InsO family protein
VAQNVLARDFRAPRPHVKWVTDITFIPTREGWLSLAVVLDLFSRMVVGWSMAATPDESLVESALHMAFTRHDPHADVLHHSDQGCPYTSNAYLALLENRGIQVSMSRTGNGSDHAVMERFFGTLSGNAPWLLRPDNRPGVPSLSTLRCLTSECVCTRPWTMRVQLILRDPRANFSVLGLYKSGSTTLLKLED